ncbi:viral A-type inclusion protein [Runella sp.]|uniref:viral A-type inclusion protein n=1 Tax=Runella sp. TaxID=1960881 RepID=UPI003D11A925
MKINPLLFGGVLLAASCQSREQSQINALEKDVMTIHDAVMPKMGELVAMESAIQRQIAQTDSLLKITPNDSTLQYVLEKSITLSSQLKKADHAMMDWMHRYRGDSLKKLLPSQAIQALTQEKINIEQVSDDMLKSIEETQNFLKQQ